MVNIAQDAVTATGFRPHSGEFPVLSEPNGDQVVVPPVPPLQDRIGAKLQEIHPAGHHHAIPPAAGDLFRPAVNHVIPPTDDNHVAIPAGNHAATPTENIGVKVDVGSVLRAQKEYIRAQTDFLHTRNVQKLAGAQAVFISALSYMLVTLDPTKAANVQEDLIGRLTRELENEGII